MAREKASDRIFLGLDGKEVDRIENATGARYVVLKAGPKDEKGEATYTTVGSVEQQFGKPGDKTTMCAIFGFHTKVGNVANSIRNDKDAPGTPDDELLSVMEWNEQLEKGVFAERAGGGGGGLRYNPDQMAAAIASVTGKPADTYLAKMQWKVNNKGEQVPIETKGAVSYAAFAYRNAKVKAAYDALVGTGTSIDAL